MGDDAEVADLSEVGHCRGALAGVGRNAKAAVAGLVSEAGRKGGFARRTPRRRKGAKFLGPSRPCPLPFASAAPPHDIFARRRGDEIWSKRFARGSPCA